MSKQKTIKQYAEEYKNTHDRNNDPRVFSKWSYLAGAAKQKELDVEKIKDYEQALKEIENDQWVLLKADLIMIQTLAGEVLKKWGAL